MSTQWQHPPGSWDAIYHQRFPTTNPFGIPDLPPAPLSATPACLIPYGQRVRTGGGLHDAAVHFFVDDYRFASVWTHPHKALRHLNRYSTLLTPDFSVFVGDPFAVQAWQVYRSRWCGAWWQSLGFTIIPTVTWSTPDDFDLCFAGLPQRSVLALSTLGTHHPAAKWHFLHGFHALLERLQPSLILCYGDPHPSMFDLCAMRVYPPFWRGIRRARSEV